MRLSHAIAVALLVLPVLLVAWVQRGLEHKHNSVLPDGVRHNTTVARLQTLVANGLEAKPDAVVGRGYKKCQ